MELETQLNTHELLIGPWARLTAFAAVAGTALAVISGAAGWGTAPRLLAAIQPSGPARIIDCDTLGVTDRGQHRVPLLALIN